MWPYSESSKYCSFLLSELSSFFWNKKKIVSHKKACENKDFFNIVMPSEGTKILGFNQYQKSDTSPFIIYADLECLIEKTDRCKNNPENPSSTKLGEHVPSNFSMSKISSFNSIKKTSMVYAEVKIA